MSRAICSLCLVFSLLTLATLTGCSDPGPAIDPAMLAKYSKQLTLADEPDGGQLVSDVRATLLGTNDEIIEEHIHEEGDDHDHEGHSEAEHADHDDHEHETAEEHAEHAHEDGDQAHEHDDDGDSEQEHAEHEEDDHEHEATEEHHEHADEHEAHADHDNHDNHDDEHAEHNHAEHAHTEDAHNHEEHAEHDHEEGEHEAEAEVVAASEIIEVVLVGQVGGLANPWKETQPDFPFTKNKAVFFLADPIAVVENEESGHNHAPGEECAFCEAHAADQSKMLAMVRFLDEKGDVLPMDVRKLFDVKVTDTIVIHGSAQVVEGGMLVVDATGLYIRR